MGLFFFAACSEESKFGNKHREAPSPISSQAPKSGPTSIPPASQNENNQTETASKPLSAALIDASGLAEYPFDLSIQKLDSLKLEKIETQTQWEVRKIPLKLLIIPDNSQSMQPFIDAAASQVKNIAHALSKKNLLETRTHFIRTDSANYLTADKWSQMTPTQKAFEILGHKSLKKAALPLDQAELLLPIASRKFRCQGTTIREENSYYRSKLKKDSHLFQLPVKDIPALENLSGEALEKAMAGAFDSIVEEIEYYNAYHFTERFEDPCFLLSQLSFRPNTNIEKPFESIINYVKLSAHSEDLSPMLDPKIQRVEDIPKMWFLIISDEPDQSGINGESMPAKAFVDELVNALAGNADAAFKQVVRENLRFFVYTEFLGKNGARKSTSHGKTDKVDPSEYQKLQEVLPKSDSIVADLGNARKTKMQQNFAKLGKELQRLVTKSLSWKSSTPVGPVAFRLEIKNQKSVSGLFDTKTGKVQYRDSYTGPIEKVLHSESSGTQTLSFVLGEKAEVDNGGQIRAEITAFVSQKK